VFNILFFFIIVSIAGLVYALVSLIFFAFKLSGRDIGTNLPNLLNALVKELPSDRSTMLRIGMTNPPFILEHLKEIAEVLNHPCVYTFLHVPVQSGSDPVLTVSFQTYWRPILGLLFLEFETKIL
jgi:tRNA A37 methylthiotransferase MiaB